MPTELSWIKRFVCSKDVQQQSELNFNFDVIEGKSLPIFVIVSFQQSYRLNVQLWKKNSFRRPPVKLAKCLIGNERYTDGSIFLNYAENEYSQSYSQIVLSTWLKMITFTL